MEARDDEYDPDGWWKRHGCYKRPVVKCADDWWNKSDDEMSERQQDIGTCPR